MSLSLMALLVITTTTHSTFAWKPDAAKSCGSCDAWNAEQTPFRVFGNTYYVGTRGLSSVLIVSDDGLILLDGALPQSAAQIAAHLRSLGFELADVKLILNSHAHFDHAGGIAALQRGSGASVVSSEAGARALRRGQAASDDPQTGFGEVDNAYPPVAEVRTVRDGEVLRLGNVAVTPHLTPGHTPGSTSWTWRSCEQTRCVDIVYADSLNAVSAPEFHFAETRRGYSTADTLRSSIARVAALPCDVLLTPHPGMAQTFERLARRDEQGDADAFIDPGACQAFAEGARRRLQERLHEEQASTAR